MIPSTTPQRKAREAVLVAALFKVLPAATQDALAIAAAAARQAKKGALVVVPSTLRAAVIVLVHGNPHRGEKRQAGPPHWLIFGHARC